MNKAREYFIKRVKSLLSAKKLTVQNIIIFFIWSLSLRAQSNMQIGKIRITCDVQFSSFMRVFTEF